MLRIAALLLALSCLFVAAGVQAVFLDCVFNDSFEASGTTDNQPVAALRLHNCARKTVVPAAASPIEPLTWSGAIAALAQTYSNACVYAHSDHAGYGENIYAAAASWRRCRMRSAHG